MDNRDFLEQLILKTNPDLDDEGVEIFVSEAEGVLEEWVFTNISAKLSNEEREEFIRLTDEENYVPGDVYKFLLKAIPDYEKFIEKVYDDFEDMYKKYYKSFDE